MIRHATSPTVRCSALQCHLPAHAPCGNVETSGNKRAPCAMCACTCRSYCPTNCVRQVRAGTLIFIAPPSPAVKCPKHFACTVGWPHAAAMPHVQCARVAVRQHSHFKSSLIRTPSSTTWPLEHPELNPTRIPDQSIREDAGGADLRRL